MNKTRVKDLMVPLSEYAVVDSDATLYEAILALDKAQKNLPPDRPPHRAVLVRDHEGNIIGKVGQLAFLRGLEAPFDLTGRGDSETLARAGISEEIAESVLEHSRYFSGSLDDVCARAGGITVGRVMNRVADSVDENMLLGEAAHKIVSLQQLSLLVTRNNKVIGLLRLSDLFESIANSIREMGS